MFQPVWTERAAETYRELQARAKAGLRSRTSGRKRGGKASRPEGLFQQVHKCLALLLSNPRHPSLQTHQYTSLENPYDRRQKVFEAYVQQHTPGAYRLFWCYGPEKGQITILAITPHP